MLFVYRAKSTGLAPPVFISRRIVFGFFYCFLVVVDWWFCVYVDRAVLLFFLDVCVVIVLIVLVYV